MKRIVRYGTIICCAILIIAIVYITIFDHQQHKSYEEVLNAIEFLSDTQEPIEEINTDGFVYRYYEDICLVYRSSGEYIRAEIIGDKYQIKDDITIGSERNIVEQSFAEKKKIKDLPDDEFGFIEDDIWVHFYYNESDIVEKILIYSVGP